MDRSQLKRIACDAIDSFEQELRQLSASIWSQPELCYQEHHAHDALAGLLEKVFPVVERGYLLETACRAEYGQGQPNVAVLCEYDALPEIGHACGHNLIAEVGAGAAIGVQAAMEAAQRAGNKVPGKLTVLGTPAEEGGAGKVRLMERGALKGVDVAMMAHPSPYSHALRAGTTALHGLDVRFVGKASHAAAYPWEGVNALDATVLAYNNVSVMRQQLKPEWRVHGIIKNGGVKPNIIPEVTELEFWVRTLNLPDLNRLKVKVEQCFHSAAQATGCQVQLSWVHWVDVPILNVLTNPTLADLYEENARSVGVELEQDPVKTSVEASTDMGNVSHEVPSIHPMFYIGSTAGNHTRAFATAAGADEAQPYTLTQAKVLAMTAIDVLWQPELLAKMKEELTNQKRE